MLRDSRFLKRLNALLETSDKSQKEIAEELGYENPNIITMFKQGLTKVPLDKLPKLARALQADPVHLTRLALDEYSKPLLEMIDQTFPSAITAHEKRLIDSHRKATRDSDPFPSDRFLADYRTMLQTHGM